MDFQIIARRISRLAQDNSPSILTAIGATGTLFTAYLTARAMFKVATAITVEEHIDQSIMPPRARVDFLKRTGLWKEFIPPVATACVSVTCIIMANRAGSKKIAALAAAYSLSEKSIHEYKDKVSEKFGKGKERAVRDEIAQEEIDRRPVSKELVLQAGGSQLCFDQWSGRYFLSDMESIRRAVNDLNQDLINYYAMSVNELYDRIGLPRCEAGEEVGWNTDQILELDYSATLSEDSRPCMVISFRTRPKVRYDKHA